MPEPLQLDDDESTFTMRLMRLFCGRLKFVRFKDQTVTVVLTDGKKKDFPRKEIFETTDVNLERKML